MKKYWESFVQLVLPNICVLCQSYLSKEEESICEICSHNLPQFEGFNVTPNNVEKLFWGRVKLENATSLLQFTSQNQTQSILHHIKYRGNKGLGIKMGKLMGLEIRKKEWIEIIDGIIPLPLHQKKLHLRGYNQSTLLGEGMAKVLLKPMYTDVVKRVVHTKSQTRLSRYERHKNVKEIFRLTGLRDLKQKHFLLVDDVVTTGATLEACTNTLQKEGAKVSVYTLATTI